MSEKAAKLASEANALFAKKDYAAAVPKYSEALAQERTNAILYSSRAACYLKLSRTREAASDALQATKLDPRNARAWSRLGAAYDALKDYGGSIEAYQEAIAIVDKPGASTQEKSQKKQFEDALKQVTGKIMDPVNMSFDTVKALARAHDMPVTGPDSLKKRQSIFNTPRFTTQPPLRVLLIPESQTEPLRQLALDRETGDIAKKIAQVLGCPLAGSEVLHSEDQMAYAKGKKCGVGIGRMHSSYEIWMDDMAPSRRPLNPRASALLHRPDAHGPILVMKTTFMKTSPDIFFARAEDILCWERVTEDELKSEDFRKKREEWVAVKQGGWKLDNPMFQVLPA